ELDGLNLQDEVVAFYESERPRRILATALAALALTEALQPEDARDAKALLRRLPPQALAKDAKQRSALLADLVGCDGMASMVGLATDLCGASDWPEEFVRACLAAKTGWDLGLAAGGNEARERATRRLCRWLRFDLARDAGTQHAPGRFAKGV